MDSPWKREIERRLMSVRFDNAVRDVKRENRKRLQAEGEYRGQVGNPKTRNIIEQGEDDGNTTNHKTAA